MSFRSVFIAVVISTALLVAAFMVNRARPPAVTQQPSAALIRASGKCAECHINQQYSVVHEYELSVHAKKNINCLDCHQTAKGQEENEHHGFKIATKVTAANCRSCHEGIYQQYLRSRHAAPSWAAVYGEKGLTDEGLTDEQIDFSERFHPKGCRRDPNPLVSLEGQLAAEGGCSKCHSIGKPNKDGSIGSCTACHTRHTSSVEIARMPSTCGQCHMGPDHSQKEIYEESKHGVQFQAQRHLLNLAADPKTLSTRDMFVPTCATCHMSGLNGLKVTHDPSERLSYYLFAEVSEKRPSWALAQAGMKDVCAMCHTNREINRVYSEAEKIVESTNEKVLDVRENIIKKLQKDGFLGTKPFQHRIDFKYFNLWHYDARTVKHGAFMGGADFVQWHGSYPLLEHAAEIKDMAEEMRGIHGKKN